MGLGVKFSGYLDLKLGIHRNAIFTVAMFLARDVLRLRVQGVLVPSCVRDVARYEPFRTCYDFVSFSLIRVPADTVGGSACRTKRTRTKHLIHAVAMKFS